MRDKIIFDAPNLQLANSTLYWYPMDTEELYLKNLREHRQLLEKDNWVNRTIEYKFNSQAFRSEEFNNEENVMFLGCSLTFGVGISVEDRWTEHVAANLNLKCYNLGIPGASTDCAFRLCYGWIDRLKPKIVVFRKPPGIRLEIIDEEDTFNISIAYLPNTVGNTWLLKWGMDEANHLLNYLKNTLAMKSLCQERNIKLVVLDESHDVEILDSARDLAHPGPKTSKKYAENVLSIIDSIGGA